MRWSSVRLLGGATRLLALRGVLLREPRVWHARAPLMYIVGTPVTHPSTIYVQQTTLVNRDESDPHEPRHCGDPSALSNF
jgi:hypothetical protein